MLTLQLLGLPQVRRDGLALTVARRKSRALLFYLAAHPRPLTRDHLLAFFWPDLDRPAAQQTLRTTLHGLRRVLGDDLLADDGTLGLAPTIGVDALAFAAQLARPTWLRPRSKPPSRSTRATSSTAPAWPTRPPSMTGPPPGAVT